MGDLQDPEMEVLYITIPYKAIEIGGISPYHICSVIGNFPAIPELAGSGHLQPGAKGILGMIT
jgi:hypothetical protein